MKGQVLYSMRKSGISKPQYNISMLNELVLAELKALGHLGYFLETFGEYEGDFPDYAAVGATVATEFLKMRAKAIVWPPHPLRMYYDEDLFDLIEYFFARVSVPTEYEYSDFGSHATAFDAKQGRKAFLNSINPLLECYERGYSLTGEGVIVEAPEEGFEQLVDAELPASTPKTVTDHVALAIDLYRKRGGTLDEKKHAIRELADALEYLKNSGLLKLPKDDSNDLFNIINNFNLRHSRPNQKSEYDRPFFFSWMFYVFLASVHASVRLSE